MRTKLFLLSLIAGLQLTAQNQTCYTTPDGTDVSSGWSYKDFIIPTGFKLDSVFVDATRTGFQEVFNMNYCPNSSSYSNCTGGTQPISYPNFTTNMYNIWLRVDTANILAPGMVRVVLPTNAGAVWNQVCFATSLILSYTATPYCVPSIITACLNGSYIDTVIINTLENSDSGCNGLPNNFISYPQSIFTTTLTTGVSYSLHLASGPSASQYFGVWVDFNHDSIYSPSEYLDSTTNSVYSFTDNITIPTNAMSGLTGMRIRSAYLPVHDTCACQQRNQGETEDYLINIVNGATTDIKQINSSGAISIYPNPTADYISIKSKEIITNIEIITLEGQKMKSINNCSSLINVSDLAKGFYFLKIEINGKSQVEKLVKE